jgi:hypothetical protein
MMKSPDCWRIKCREFSKPQGSVESPEGLDFERVLYGPRSGVDSFAGLIVTRLPTELARNDRGECS